MSEADKPIITDPELVFEYELDNIRSPNLRQDVIGILKNLPNAFYDAPASFTGKYHHGETLVEHTKQVYTLVEHLGFLFCLPPNQMACLRAAALLHDGMRCVPGPNGSMTDRHDIRMAEFIDVANWTSGWDYKMAIQEAVKLHMSWWGDNLFDFRVTFIQEPITSLLILADYLASRSDVIVEIPD